MERIRSSKERRGHLPTPVGSDTLLHYMEWLASSREQVERVKERICGFLDTRPALKHEFEKWLAAKPESTVSDLRYWLKSDREPVHRIRLIVDNINAPEVRP